MPQALTGISLSVHVESIVVLFPRIKVKYNLFLFLTKFPENPAQYCAHKGHKCV